MMHSAFCSPGFSKQAIGKQNVHFARSKGLLIWISVFTAFYRSIFIFVLKQLFKVLSFPRLHNKIFRFKID